MPSENLFSDNGSVKYKHIEPQLYERKSVIRTRRHLRLQFNVPKRGPITSRNIILGYIRKCEAGGSVSNTVHDAPRTVRTEHARTQNFSLGWGVLFLRLYIIRLIVKIVIKIMS